MTRWMVSLLALTLAGCGQASDDEVDARDAGIDAAVDGATSVICTPCGESSDCGPGAVCAQYAGSDYCGRVCGLGHCGNGETCLQTVAEDGAEVEVCVPSNGSCGQHGCGTCPPGESCDLVSGNCVEPEPDGGDDGGPDEPDAGEPDAGEPDAGSKPDGGSTAPHVGPDGGKVDDLYFAVVGDTRPPGSNDTAHYPSAIITKIYDDIQAMSPRPQFVVTTGDYMFASPSGKEGPKQMKLYLEARAHYKGTVFGVLGNHECGGGNANCAGVTSNNSYNAFLDGLVKPLGKTKLYYQVPISDLSGKWTAKLLIVACNAWSKAQKSWLEGELAKPTTYTFIARHQPKGSDAPCSADMAPMLDGAKYNLLMVGHVHKYLHSGKQLIEGVGGAPLTGTHNHGFATVRQLAGGGFRIKQYDYKTKQVVGSFTVP